MKRRRAAVVEKPIRDLSLGELAVIRAIELLDNAAEIFDVLTTSAPAERKAFEHARLALEDARHFARVALDKSRAT